MQTNEKNMQYLKRNKTKKKRGKLLFKMRNEKKGKMLESGEKKKKKN